MWEARNKNLLVSSCTLKLSVNKNTNLSLTITSLKWISVHFFCLRVPSQRSELLSFWEECPYHHDHRCSRWMFASSPAQMSQGLSRTGGVFMSLLQCTLPAKQMPTSALVIWKGCCKVCLHCRSCPRQHTQVSATRLLVAFVWKWRPVTSSLVAAPEVWGPQPPKWESPGNSAMRKRPITNYWLYYQ